MKTHTIRRYAFALLLCMLSLLLAPAIGAAAFALPALPSLHYQPAPLWLGTVFNAPNSTTVANQVANNADARQEIWVESILDGSISEPTDAPLAQGGFMGRVKPGQKPSPGQLMKAVVEVSDFSKVAGKTIHIPTRAGFGGPITTGENDRLGNEQKIIVGGFDCSIGRGWYGVAYTAIARDETFQGPMYEQWIRDALRQQHAKQRNDDHLMRLRDVTSSGVGLANVMLPENVASIPALKTANVLDTNLINQSGEYLPSLGGMPMDLSEDSGGSLSELFIVFATDRALSPLGNEPAYVEMQKNAGVRGDSNRLFKGGLSMVNGHGVYKWYNRDHNNKGPIGSPLLPRTRLGIALTGADTGSFIDGGGLNYSGGDSPAREYTKFFRNAPYTYYNGDTIAADTNTVRHVMIINNDGTGIGFYSFKVNTGLRITIFARVALTGISQVNDHPQGSLVVECNILGTPIGYTPMFGQQALVCGVGTINGSTVNPKMGNITEEVLGHKMHYSIGVEGVWGNAVVRRAGDNYYPNFLLMVHAIPVPGAPAIT